MSRSVDERIVEMQFDNRDFESNVKTSMGTLDRLKQALNFDNAADGLDYLGKATKNLRFDGISSALDSIKDRFSTMGIIGMTILQNITNAALNVAKTLISAVPRQIMNGGWTRAMNLENAHFQLMGLIKDEEQVKAVMEDVSYAVDGTAYGLDAAAKVASQLAASGLRAGDNMKNALRGISGVAAMTNSEYEEIGHIFATVAGNGRLMGDQLNQLAVRGINAAAILAERFGVSESDLREMVSKGKIDFQTFANAMDEAFGEHAKDANKTFEGVIRNIRAALSRIGAEFATPLIQNAIEPLNRVREKINEIKKYMKPLYESFAKLAPIVSKVLNDKIANMKFGWVQLFSQSLLNAFSGILLILAPITQAFRDIFPPTTLRQLLDFTSKLRAFTEQLLISEETASRIRHVFRGVFSVFDIMGQAVLAVGRALSPVVAKLKEYAKTALDVLAIGGELIAYTANYIRENDLFTKAINLLIEKFTTFFNNVRTYGMPVLEIFKTGINGIVTAVRAAMPSVDNFLNKFGKDSEGKLNPFVMIFNMLSVVADNFFKLFEKGITGAFKLITKLKTGFFGLISLINEAFGKGSNAGQALKDSAFALILYQLKNILIQIKMLGKGLLDPTGITSVMEAAKNAFVSFSKSLDAKYILAIAGAIAILVVSMKILSTVPADKIFGVTQAIGALMIALVGMSSELSGLNKGVFQTSSGPIVALAASLLILAGAAKMLSKIPFTEMQFGILGVLELLGMMAVTIAGLSFLENDLPKMSAALLGFSVSLLILASAVNKLSTIPWDEMQLGILGVLELLGMMTIASIAVSKFGDDMPKGAAGMIAMALAVNVLALAVNKLGNMDLNVLLQGIPSVCVLLAGLAIAGMALGESKHIFAAGVATLAMAAALNILAGAVEKLGSLTESQLMYGISSLFILLLEIGAFGKIMGDQAGKFLAVSVALGVFTASLTLLASVVALFGSMDFDTLAKGVLGIAGALIIFGGLAVLLQSAIVPMLGLAGAIALIGAGVGIASAGIAVLSVALTTLAGSTMVIGELIIGALTALGAGIGNLFLNLARTIASNIGQLKQSAGTVLGALIDVIIEYVPKGVQAIIKLVQGLLNAISEKLPELVAKGLELLQGFIQGLISGLPELINTAFLLVITFINGLADSIRENQQLLIDAVNNLMEAVIEAIIAFVVTFIEGGKKLIGGLITGITGSDEDPADAFDNMLRDAVEGIRKRISDFISAGGDVISGFLQGLNSAKQTALNAVADFGGRIVSAFRSRDGIDSNSPSRAFASAAQDSAAGYTQQLKKEEGPTRQSVLEYVQNAVLNPLTEKAGDVKNVFTDMFVTGGTGIQEFAKRYLGDFVPALDEGTESVTENKQSLEQLSESLESTGTTVEKTGKKVEKETEKAEKKVYSFAEAFQYMLENSTEMMADFANRFHDDIHSMYEEAIEMSEDGFFVEHWDMKAAYDALYMLGEKFYLMSDDAKKAAEEAGVSLEELEYNIEDVAKALSDARKEIIDNIKSQISIFEEFDAKTDLTAEKLLENMKSQIDGVASWSNKLEILSRRGIDQGLLMHLAEMGPKGYEYVNAFVQMSEEQLTQAGTLYQQSLILPEAAANQILSSYAYAGWSATAGFNQGIDEGIDEVENKVIYMANSALNALTGSEGLDEHSPSRKTRTIGENFDQGLINGVNAKESTVLNAVRNLAQKVISTAKTWLDQNKFKQIGANIDNGLANGISSNASAPINAAIAVAQSTLSAVKSALGVASPSTEGISIGRYLMIGFRNGISDNADKPIGAVRDMSSTILDALMASKDILAENDNLVITPVLDLSSIYSGANEIGQIIGGQSVGVAGIGSGSYSGYGSTTNNTATNTFNISVNGGPNSNPREIADEVISRINSQLVRGKAVYA